MLLRSIADHPRCARSQVLLHVTPDNGCSRSDHVVQHTRVLDALTSTKIASVVLGTSQVFSAQVTAHLMQSELYGLSSRAISSVVCSTSSLASSICSWTVPQPVADKNAPALPFLISLCITPFTTFGPTSNTASESLYTTALVQLFIHLLAVPLLPNRLPLPSLTLLSKSIPFASLPSAHSAIVTTLPATSLDHKVHILANLLAFVPPRYAALPPRALAAYLDLLAQLLGVIPPNALEPASPEKTPAASASWALDPDDEDEDTICVERVDTFATTPAAKMPTLDAKTLARLGTLSASTHIRALVGAAKADARPHLAAFLLSLHAAWPARKGRVMSAVLAQAGGALVRELYRGWVRGSSLGREGGNPFMRESTF
jgi:ubiquitin-protein ligase E3 C